MKHTLAGGLVERAHGRSVGMDAAQIFAAGMLPQGCLSGMPQFFDCGYPLFDIEHRTDLGPSMVDVRMGMLMFVVLLLKSCSLRYLQVDVLISPCRVCFFFHRSNSNNQ